MELNEKMFVRTSGGWFRLTPTKIGGDDKVGALLAAKAAQPFHNAFQLGGSPAHVALSGPPSSRTALISCRVNKLKMHTFYSAVGGVLTPVFRSTGDAVRMDLEWAPPSSMQVWFGVLAAYRRTAWHHDSAFLFLKSTNPAHAGTFKMPLPNCYEHGAVCLGHREWASGGAITVAKEAYDQLQSATWNTDLLFDSDAAARRELFRFDLATGKQIPSTVEWERLVRRLSNAIIDTAITQ